MFQQLTVATRLGLGFGLLLTLMIAVSLISNAQVGFIDRTLQEVREGASVKQRHAINFRGSVHDRAIAIRDAILVTDLAAVAPHLREVERLARFYQESATALDALFAVSEPSAQERQQLAELLNGEVRFFQV